MKPTSSFLACLIGLILVPTLDGDGFDLLDWSVARQRYDYSTFVEPLVQDGGFELQFHPGQNGPNWGVIRWTTGVGEDGLVNFSGNFRKQNTAGTSVTGALFADGVLIDSVTLAGNDGVGVSFDENIFVSAGSVVDFVIGTDGDSSGDLSGLNVSISSVPEPSTSMLLALSGVMGLICRRRRGNRLA
jgi:hypothetical protein